MNIYKYLDNSQQIWIYPGWYTKQCPEKLPIDKKAKHGYHKPLCIFECEAAGILESDKMVEEALNSGKVVLQGEKKKPKTYDVTKMPHISVSFSKLTFWKKVGKFLTYVFYCGIVFIQRRNE